MGAIQQRVLIPSSDSRFQKPDDCLKEDDVVVLEVSKGTDRAATPWEHEHHYF